jgi:hypothetical protein
MLEVRNFWGRHHGGRVNGLSGKCPPPPRKQ